MGSRLNGTRIVNDFVSPLPSLPILVKVPPAVTRSPLGVSAELWAAASTESVSVSRSGR
ncbi:MAG: hypothetical protein L0K86_05025 [Actinomycetia bacterium]|nr:hypothetical protein [Actinomycetes bacterium]